MQKKKTTGTTTAPNAASGITRDVLAIAAVLPSAQRRKLLASARALQKGFAE